MSKGIGQMTATWLVALGACVSLVLSLAGVAHAKGEFELNDSRATAHGPLAGGKWYTAGIETVNDVDWYVFYIKSYSQVDFSATTVKGESSCDEPYIRLYDKDGQSLGHPRFYGGPINEVRHLNLTMDPGRYYMQVDDCKGARYKFRIDPASALTTSRECGEAILARNDAAPELVKVTGLIANNTSSLAKVDGVIAKQNARLVGLTRHWRKLKKRWKRNGRKINKGRGSRYSKARARGRLSSSKRKANQRLSAKKRQPKAKLEKASATREEILAKRLALQTLGAQHTVAVSGADRTIADHC